MAPDTLLSELQRRQGYQQEVIKDLVRLHQVPRARAREIVLRYGSQIEQMRLKGIREDTAAIWTKQMINTREEARF